MTKRLLLPLFFLLMNLAFVRSQDNNDLALWVEQPGFPGLAPGNEGENVVAIFIDEGFVYSYDDAGDLKVIHTIHRRYRLFTDDAVNRFNKLSVSLSDVNDVVELRARVIKQDGKTLEFDSKNIREITDEESGDNYKIFAIDGIEKGDDIEYLIVRNMDGGNFGRVYFQYNYPVQHAEFRLTSPDNLVYAVKGYNGLTDPLAGVLEDGRHFLAVAYDSIPALKDMSYENFNPRRGRLEIKLDYNYNRSKARLLTWDDASKRIYEMMYQDVSPSSLEKWLSLVRIKNGTSLEKASKLEEYIKTNIHIEDFDLPEYMDLDYMRTRKVSGEQGIVRLYANLLKGLGIKHEIVLTCDRSEIRFDPDFQSWNYLSKYLIYLPDDSIFIDPANIALRAGYVDGNLTATYGLFVGLVKFGNFESAIGKIKYIEPLPYTESYDNMNIEISVDIDKVETRVVIERGFKGLAGGYFGRLFKTLDNEGKENVLRNIMSTKAPDPDYSVLKVVEKSDIDFLADAEFIIYSDFTTPSFFETAGNKLILNIGESIGPQVELYSDQENDRGAESPFNHFYLRRIILDIPDGYRIVNPDAVDMNITGGAGDDPPFGFISTHEYSENRYIVNINEYYRDIYVKPEDFGGFRDVVNAAANFNKVVLILEEGRE